MPRDPNDHCFTSLHLQRQIDNAEERGKQELDQGAWLHEDHQTDKKQSSKHLEEPAGAWTCNKWIIYGPIARSQAAAAEQQQQQQQQEHSDWGANMM